MKKILEVPYYSQQDETKREEWKLHSCGVVCIGAVIEFLNGEKANIEKLIDEGVSIGGHVSGKWSHESLVRLARNHGLNAYPQEFKSVKVEGDNFLDNPNESELINFGIDKIIKNIDKGFPVMVSVKPGFNTNNLGHMVLIVGYEYDSFIINDSDTREGRQENIRVSIERFKEYWRKFAIFFEK